jgi:hypothetical protein
VYRSTERIAIVLDGDPESHISRHDGTVVSREYIEAIRRDARREAEAAMRGTLTTLAVALCAYADAYDRSP